MCPSCGEDVHVGTAGPSGLAQHEGKGPCRKSQAKKEQKRQARTLFDLGLKRVKDIPTSSPAAAGSSARKNLKSPSPVVYARAKDVNEEIQTRKMIFVHIVVRHFLGTGKSRIKSWSMLPRTSFSTSLLTYHRSYVVCVFGPPHSACSTCEKEKEQEPQIR